MVDRYTTPPLELPGADETFDRADLIFLGLDHSLHSFEARLFADAPDVDHAAGPDHPAYVDSFFVFGHGGCFGDVGHCDIPTERDDYDLRPPHQLLPAIRIVTVTELIERLVGEGKETFTLTVVAHTAGDRSNDVLAFDKVRLALYAP
jgi:hypothetical protein